MPFQTTIRPFFASDRLSDIRLYHNFCFVGITLCNCAREVFHGIMRGAGEKKTMIRILRKDRRMRFKSAKDAAAVFVLAALACGMTLADVHISGGECATSTRCSLFGDARAEGGFLVCHGGGAMLDSGALRLEFADAERGFSPTGIVNRLSGEVRFLSGRQDAALPDFWRLTFSRLDSTGGVKKVALDNRSKASSHSIDNADGKLIFHWQGMDLPGEVGVVDVAASIELVRGGAASEWRISVANRSGSWGLYETDYPCLNHIVEPGEADVLLPHENLGARLLRRFDGNTQDRRHLWGYYEAPSAVPMVTAFMKNGSGLYVAAHDAEQRIKTMRQKNMCLWFNTPVENMGQVGRAASGPGYAVTVAAFRGDWWEAARMYREWALKQKWAAKGPIAHRTDFPKAMSETDFWISFHLLKTLDSFTNAIENIRRGMDGANLGLRFYRWYPGCEVGDMCLNFPENFPPRIGVKEAVAQFRQKGIVVMPYTNPHIYDALLESFGYVLPDACRRENGGWYSEPYAGGTYGRHDFAVMCPCAARWQATIDNFSDRLFRETGANAIYYDQVGCGPPRLCFAADHGHPAGGGGWWARGRHEYLAQAHAK